MKKREVLYGEYEIKPLESEEISRTMARRSLVLNKALLSGTVLKQEHLTAKDLELELVWQKLKMSW